MKPEDIPKDVWDKVCVLVPSYIDTSSYDLVRINMTRASVARSITQDRSQALEDCAKIADDYAAQFPTYPEFDDLHNAAVSIAQTIRSKANQ